MEGMGSKLASRRRLKLPHHSGPLRLAVREGEATGDEGKFRRRASSLPPLIHIRKASVFLGSRRVLREVNWELRAGEHWAVLGGNGAGKTTFLKLVLGELHPALGGQVRRFEFTSRDPVWEVRRRMGWMSSR